MKTEDNILAAARRTVRIEAEAVGALEGRLHNIGVVVAALGSCTGRIIISGIGKSAIIAQKIVATLNSTGTPALFLHAADAIHGDLGLVQKDDAVMIISKSGESPEIKVLVPLIKNFGNLLIAMVGSSESFLARRADHILDTTVTQEACPNNLAPTTSTTAQLVMGDVLAVCLMEQRGFKAEDFAKLHPGGTLGKKLYLRVGDLSADNAKPQVDAEASVKEVIMEITRNRLGLTAVTNRTGNVVGVVTDGDLRRMLERSDSIENIRAKDIMTMHPKTIAPGELAVNALDLMRQNQITQLIVEEEDQYAGVIHLHDLIKEGLI